MCGSAGAHILLSRRHNEKEFHLARCPSCGQHFCDPAPTRAEIAALYSGDYHQNLRSPGATEKEFGEKFRRYRDWILRFVKPGRSLDIGTSTGLFPSLLKQSGFEAEGIEYNEESAKWAQSHYQIRILPGLEYLQPGAYDLISMTDVLEHQEHPLNYLRSIRQHLKPRGFMLITFPDIRSPESLYFRFLSQLLRREWLWSCCYIPDHIWEFTPATAKRMFHKAGFEVLGFRRSQPAREPSAGILRILQLPARLLEPGPIGRVAGTQMEFIIRRRD